MQNQLNSHINKDYTLYSLIKCIHRNDTRNAQAILQANPHFANQMYSGRTLLSFAAASGNNHMIRLLLNNGAEVNNRNKNGVPAIVQAITHNHLSTVILLHQNGADIDCVGAEHFLKIIDLAILNGLYQISLFLYDHVKDKTFKKPEQYAAIAKIYYIRFVDYEAFLQGLSEGKKINQMPNFLAKKYQQVDQNSQNICQKWFNKLFVWKSYSKALQNRNLPTEAKTAVIKQTKVQGETSIQLNSDRGMKYK